MQYGGKCRSCIQSITYRNPTSTRRRMRDNTSPIAPSLFCKSFTHFRTSYACFEGHRCFRHNALVFPSVDRSELEATSKLTKESHRIIGIHNKISLKASKTRFLSTY